MIMKNEAIDLKRDPIIFTHKWSDGVLSVDGEARPRVVHGAVVVVFHAETGDLFLGVLEEVAVIAGLDVLPLDCHVVVPKVIS